MGRSGDCRQTKEARRLRDKSVASIDLTTLGTDETSRRVPQVHWPGGSLADHIARRDARRGLAQLRLCPPLPGTRLPQLCLFCKAGHHEPPPAFDPSPKLLGFPQAYSIPM